MQIQSAFNSGVQGFLKASASANKAAADIVQATNAGVQENREPRATEQIETPKLSKKEQLAKSSPGFTESIVNLKVAEFQAKASAKVIKTADSNLGTLIDVRA